MYLPHLGIFAQTDPIGYADSPNLYSYVVDDPVNLIDPLGQRTFIAARPIQTGGEISALLGIGHMFLIDNARYVGDPNATIISFGGDNGQLQLSPATRAYDQTRWIAQTDVRFMEVGLPNGLLGQIASQFPRGVNYEIFQQNSNTAAYTVLLTALSTYFGVNVTGVDLAPVGLWTPGATAGTITISGQYEASRITWTRTVTIVMNPDGSGTACVRTSSGKIECRAKKK